MNRLKKLTGLALLVGAATGGFYAHDELSEYDLERQKILEKSVSMYATPEGIIIEEKSYEFKPFGVMNGAPSRKKSNYLAMVEESKH